MVLAQEVQPLRLLPCRIRMVEGPRDEVSGIGGGDGREAVQGRARRRGSWCLELGAGRRKGASEEGGRGGGDSLRMVYEDVEGGGLPRVIG